MNLVVTNIDQSRWIATFSCVILVSAILNGCRGDEQSDGSDQAGSETTNEIDGKWTNVEGAEDSNGSFIWVRKEDLEFEPDGTIKISVTHNRQAYQYGKVPLPSSLKGQYWKDEEDDLLFHIELGEDVYSAHLNTEGLQVNWGGEGGSTFYERGQ